MATRNATAVWTGGLKDGGGTVRLGSGAFEGAYSFSSRFEEGTGTNPEELIGAAHSGCFSMAFALMLSQKGFTPTAIETTATVRLEKQEAGFSITGIHLDTRGTVPGVDKAQFQSIAEEAKAGCPVSRALGAVPITLQARLVG